MGPNRPLVATTLGFTSDDLSPPRRELGNPPGPRSSALEDVFASKAEQETIMVQQEGTGLEARKTGFQEPAPPCLLL